MDIYIFRRHDRANKYKIQDLIMGGQNLKLVVSGSAHVKVSQTHVTAEKSSCVFKDGSLKITGCSSNVSLFGGTSVSTNGGVVRIDGNVSEIILNGRSIAIEEDNPAECSACFKIPEGYTINAVNADGSSAISFEKVDSAYPMMVVRANGASHVDLGSNKIDDLRINAAGKSVVSCANASQTNLELSGKACVREIHATKGMMIFASGMSSVQGTISPGASVYRDTSGMGKIKIKTVDA